MLKINLKNISSFLAYKEEDEYKYKYLEGQLNEISAMK